MLRHMHLFPAQLADLCVLGATVCGNWVLNVRGYSSKAVLVCAVQGYDIVCYVLSPLWYVYMGMQCCAMALCEMAASWQVTNNT
jgi:hypothetical protein